MNSCLCGKKNCRFPAGLDGYLGVTWQRNGLDHWYEADAEFSRLVQSETTSICPYKGFATEYWSVEDETVIEDIAWSYPEPFFPYRNIAGAVAFVNEKLDIFIDGELQPRPD